MNFLHNIIPLQKIFEQLYINKNRCKNQAENIVSENYYWYFHFHKVGVSY